MQSSSQVEKPAIEPRSSRAIEIWLAIIGMVVAVLYFQTRSNQINKQNLIIEGGRLAADAEVVLDGKSVGKLAFGTDGATSSSSLRLNVADGAHTIEVKKSGFKPFSTQIKIEGEDYVPVKLVAEGSSGKTDKTD